jgi:hypothetical protein
MRLKRADAPGDSRRRHAELLCGKSKISQIDDADEDPRDLKIDS